MTKQHTKFLENNFYDIFKEVLSENYKKYNDPEREAPLNNRDADEVLIDICEVEKEKTYYLKSTKHWLESNNLDPEKVGIEKLAERAKVLKKLKEFLNLWNL